ncbi:hypothetical protein C0993_005860, partial [Termitomyces sp. T159_Od127]
MYSGSSYNLGTASRKDLTDAHELLDGAWVNADLVDHCFGNVVSSSLAAKLALCFLHYGILSVKIGDKKVGREDWPAACIHAASMARAAPSKASEAGSTTQDMDEQYTWSWSMHLTTGTDRGAQQFLNIVGFLGYILANVFELDPGNMSERRLKTRITTLPKSYSRMPLGSAGQRCRPGFFALHRTAFVSQSNRDPMRKGEYVEESSILLTISTFWPVLGRKLSRIFYPSSQKNVRNEEVEGGALVDDVTNGKSAAKGDEKDTNNS